MFRSFASVLRASAALVLFLSLSGACAAAKPLPPESELNSAKKLVIDTFRAELSAADKVPAIQSMLETAAKTEGDDAGQAALYLSAADVAARAGETKLAFQALEGLAAMFEVDLLTLKLVSMESAAKHAKTPSARVSVANRCLELVGDASKANRFDLADDALKTASTVSSKLKNAELRTDIAGKRKDMEKARRQAEQVETALAAANKILKEKPNDPEANEAVGKRLAFDDNDWSAGLKHLAKAADADLQKAALADQAGAAEPSKTSTLGDLWWNLAEGAESARDKAGYRSRAVFWYTRALAGLNGLAKARVEKRLKDAGEAALTAAAAQTGADNDAFVDITLAPGVLMRLVKIPASADGKIKSFYLGQTEVTQKQWQAVMGSNPSTFNGGDLPVGNLSIDDCRALVKALNVTEAARRVSFRLVTKDECEHAYLAARPNSAYARAISDFAWVAPQSSGKPHPVASKKPNAFGLYDTIGNNWEILEGAQMAGGCFWQTADECAKGFMLDKLETNPKFAGYKNPAFGVRLAAEPK